MTAWRFVRIVTAQKEEAPRGCRMVDFEKLCERELADARWICVPESFRSHHLWQGFELSQPEEECVGRR